MKKIYFLAALLLSLIHAVALAAAVEDELLEPEKAFAITTRVLDASTLEASWKIAPGYYMYRDKFKFETVTGGDSLKSPVYPTGKIKNDPLFGKVETYVGGVRVKLPLDRQNATAHTLQLKITAQGCNEPVGVCYAPMVNTASFNLPAQAGVANPAANATGATNEIRSLKDLVKAVDGPSQNLQEPPDPEKAFRLSVAPQPNALLVRMEIDDCCYLYRDKFKFELTDAGGKPVPNAGLGKFELPAGKIKNDPYIGKTAIFEKGFEVAIPVSGLSDNSTAMLAVTYQGCSEKGVAICYPPTTKRFATTLAAIAGVAPASADSSAPVTSGSKMGFNEFVLAVVAAFGVGLLLTFTPCVLPMIPILSSVIVGSSDRHVTKWEGSLLSSLYVLGTAVTYTVAGVLAGATGDQLQSYFQNAWALGTFAAVFVLLSLSMFGFYELQMPHFVQSVLHKHSADLHLKTKHTKTGAMIGVFVMGLFSALIVGACVSPLLISALGVAIANRDPVLGGAIMFSMALGMGVVLIGIGIGMGSLIPKAGAWMNQVKHVFGVLLIAVAIYLLGFLPQVPVLYLWGVLLIVSAVYLGATQNLEHGASGWKYLWKGLGTLLLVWGVLALLGGMNGNRDVFNPLPLQSLNLPGAQASTKPETAEHLFERVPTLAALESKLAEAQKSGKPVLLDYYATWCTDCVRMEKSTFAEARVREEFKRFVLLQADVTDPNDPGTKAIKQKYGVFGPPALLFFGTDGAEKRELRTYGYRAPNEFLALLKKI